ncbi:MAG: Eco57I restriction-modification methylase domain-containing protein [Candidatus Hermodarchaeota archaeon]
MKGYDWEYFRKQMEQSSLESLNLEPFFRLCISYLFLFPYLFQETFKNKLGFLDHINHESKFWEIEWIKDFYHFQLSPNTFDYLLQEDWWWNSFFNLGIINTPIDSYALSNLHMALRKINKQKTLGMFFTPINQVKLICNNALFFFLRNRRILKDETLYNLIFQEEYPLSLPKKVGDQLLKVLKTIKVLDPCCGTGFFLLEMSRLILSLIFKNPFFDRMSEEKERKIIEDVFLNLNGYDIDSDNVRLTKIILTKQYFMMVQNQKPDEKEFRNFLHLNLQVFEKDFLIENDTYQKSFDLIIGNPPYIRHHELDSNYLKKLEEKTIFFNEIKALFHQRSFTWDRKADLYIYFWLKAIILLDEGSILSFVLSRAWLSARYALPLKTVLLTNFHLDLIIELPFEVWKSVEIRTHIIIGHKTTNRISHKVNFLVWKESVKSLLNFQAFILNTRNMNTLFLSSDSKLVIKSQENNYYRFSQISDISPLLKNSETLFPFLRLDYLEMSSFLLNLLITKRTRFCLLKDLGKLEMGSTTGFNQFFYLTNETIKKLGIPKKNLHPMTKSPKEWSTIFVLNEKKMKYILHIPRKLSKNSPKELKKYIYDLQDIILKRPFFRNKTKENWYQVPLIQPDLLLPNMIFKRSFVAYNHNKLHIDKQWIGFWTNDKSWIFPLLAFLNSSLGVLLREVQGTKTLGLGSLKLSLQECQSLLVLDPRMISPELIVLFQNLVKKLGELQIDTIQQGKETEFTKVQKQLDHLILVKCLEMDSSEIKKIREILNFEICWRLAREKKIIKDRRLQRLYDD